MYLGGKHGFPLKNEFVQRGPRLCCVSQAFSAGNVQDAEQREVCGTACAFGVAYEEWREVGVSYYIFTKNLFLSFSVQSSVGPVRYNSSHIYLYNTLYIYIYNIFIIK